MIDENFFISLVGGNIKKYGSEYSFDIPTIFVQATNKKENTIGYTCDAHFWLVYGSPEEAENLTMRLNNALQPGDKNDLAYFYRVRVTDDSGGELLPNGFKMRELTYEILYEEVS